MSLVQLEGHTRIGASAAAATAVTGIITVLFRWKDTIIRPEPTWDNATPDAELGDSQNEVELLFKNGDMTSGSALAAILAAKVAGTTKLVVAAAQSDAAISGTNKLYHATVTLAGVEIFGKVKQENTQRWVYPCGVITALSTDPAGT